MALKIERVHEVVIRKDELLFLDKKTRAFFIFSCFAINEIFCLQKMLIMTINDRPRQYIAFDYHATMQGLILRVLCAKVYQYFDALRDVSKKWKKSNPSAFEMFSGRLKQIKAIQNSREYRFLKLIRDKLSSHYNVEKIEHFILNITHRRQLKIYLHEENGNSLFHIGEEIMHAGLIKEYIESTGGPIPGDISEWEKWLNWQFETTSILIDIHTDISAKVVLQYLNKSAKGRVIYLSPSLVADKNEVRILVFLRNFD